MSHALAIEPVNRRLYWTSNRDGICSIGLDRTNLLRRIVMPNGQYGIAILVPEPRSIALAGAGVLLLLCLDASVSSVLLRRCRNGYHRKKSRSVKLFERK